MSGRGREPRTKAGRDLRDIIESIPWHPVPRNAGELIRAVEKEAAGVRVAPSPTGEPNWNPDATGVCLCGGQCHHNGRTCSQSCREANERTSSPDAPELREAAQELLDAQASPDNRLSWVIESQEARAEGRPNRVTAANERVAKAYAALRAALALPPRDALNVESLVKAYLIVVANTAWPEKNMPVSMWRLIAREYAAQSKEPTP